MENIRLTQRFSTYGPCILLKRYKIIVAKYQMINAADIAMKVPIATCMNNGCVLAHKQKDCHISALLNFIDGQMSILTLQWLVGTSIDFDPTEYQNRLTQINC